MNNALVVDTMARKAIDNLEAANAMADSIARIAQCVKDGSCSPEEAVRLMASASAKIQNRLQTGARDIAALGMRAR